MWKKWNAQSFENAITEALLEVDPTYQFTTAVKAESMPEGKAPRFLIADQDVGQVLALLTVKCVEDLTKKQHCPTIVIWVIRKRGQLKHGRINEDVPPGMRSEIEKILDILGSFCWDWSICTLSFFGRDLPEKMNIHPCVFFLQ